MSKPNEFTIEIVINFMNCASLIGSRALPVKFGFMLALNIEKLQPIGKSFNEANEKLLDKYVVKDDKGDRVIKDAQFTLTDEKSYIADRLKLMETKVSIDFEMVEFDDLPKELEPGVIAGLLPMIERSKSPPAKRGK